MTEAVLLAVQGSIEQAVEMEKMLPFIDTIAFAKAQVQKLQQQLEQSESDIKRCQRYQKGLYQAFAEGNASQSDYDLFYAEYAQEQEAAAQQAKLVKRELEAIFAGVDRQGVWLRLLKKHRNITELNRQIMLCIIDSILVMDKAVIEIVFHYQDEYETLTVLPQQGVL